MDALKALDGVALTGFVALLGWAAASDLRRFVIPNRVCLLLALLYPVHAAASGAPLAAGLWALALALGVLALGAGLFFLRLMGGGDAKLLAAVGLWAGPALMAPYLTVTALAGGALALALIARRALGRRLGLAAGGIGALACERMPYGVAIAAGGVFVAVRLMQL